METNQPTKNYYYLDASNQPKGPHTLEQLSEMARAGEISDATMLAAEGDTEWKPWRHLRVVIAQGGGTATATAPVPGAQPLTAINVNKTARQAVDSFKRFATDPVGGLAVACESLDNSSAIGVGIAFGLTFILCLLIAALKASGASLKELVKLDYFLLASTPFVCLAASSFLARNIFRGTGRLGNDCFVAGAALLPFGFAILLGGFLGVGNAEIIAMLGVFAICLTIMILYAGCNRIAKLSERAATFAVPVMLCISAFIAKVLFASQIDKLIPKDFMP